MALKLLMVHFSRSSIQKTELKKSYTDPVAAGQTDVKIDIFRGDGEGMFNSVYVASLILNNIGSDSKSGTEIELLSVSVMIIYLMQKHMIKFQEKNSCFR